MDKEDCIQLLLSTLQEPRWKSGNSITDWDLKSVLWGAGLLLSPEQAAALLADMKRRGLISCRDRRIDNKIVAMWGVKVTPAGEEWLTHRIAAATPRRDSTDPAPSPSPEPGGTEILTTAAPVEAGLS